MTILYILILFFLADSAFALYLGIRGKRTKPGGISLFAKFTPGAIVSEIRGKIASTVFARNRGGAIIRNRIKGTNRRSTLQTNVRQRLSALASEWRGLTELQRGSWNNASPQFPTQDNLGQQIFLTGEQLFIRSNANLILIGEAQITDAPIPTSFPAITASFTVLTDAAITVGFTPDPVPAGFKLVIFATAGVSAGRSFVNENQFRFMLAVAPAGASPADIEAVYTAVFGTLSVTGLKVSVKAFLVEITSGLAGIPVRVTQIVA